MTSDSKPSPGQVNRRQFCAVLGTGSLAAAAAGSVGVTADFLAPNVLMEPSMVFEAGQPDEYTPDSVTLFSKQKVFIVRRADGAFLALSAVCTHLGCIANWKSDERVIACPCHGSRFSTDGAVLAGPAPHPLVRVQIALTEENRMIVDPGVVVDSETILRV